MKYSFKPFIVNLAMITVVALSSCQKENVLSTSDSAAIQAAVAQTQAVAVSVSSTTAGDSVYIIGTCPERGHRDSIAFSSLPSSVTDYLNANYSGYTALKAFASKDASGTLRGYVVIISYNGNPVGLKFDANGNFVQVLEQREGHDLLGKGFHDGGCFEHRDGKQRDTIALSTLPAAITAYFAANYPTDTLIRAGKTREGGYIVLSKNNGVYATVFSSTGTFINRVQAPAPHGNISSIDQSALPANALSYLSSTYPNYVFNKAFSITVNGVVQGYCVVVEANSTKYAIQFDASGNFIKTKTIR